jgi:hypothetical protein
MPIFTPASSDPERFLTEKGELGPFQDTPLRIPDPEPARVQKTATTSIHLRIDFDALAADLRALADAIEGAGRLREIEEHERAAEEARRCTCRVQNPAERAAAYTAPAGVEPHAIGCPNWGRKETGR